MAADGAALYKSKCSMCHGVDGQGTVMGNAFKGNRFIASGSEKIINEVILIGAMVLRRSTRSLLWVCQHRSSVMPKSVQ